MVAGRTQVGYSAGFAGNLSFYHYKQTYTRMMKHRPTLLLLLLTMALTMQAGTENIRIMSYNIPMGNIKPEEGNGDNTWAKRALAIHRYMATVQPDLVGMQEPVRASLCDMLRGMPGYAMVGTGRNDGKEGAETEEDAKAEPEAERSKEGATGTTSK